MTAVSSRGLFRATGVDIDPAAVKRFVGKLSPADAGGCREWKGCRGSDGYGHFRYMGKIVSAHRFSFAAHNRYWPNEHVRHTCDNPLCCEPFHLEEGSHKQNMEDCAARQRNRGPRLGNGKSKLSPESITLIRQRFWKGETNKSALAREFNVTPTRIRQVVYG